MTHHSTEVVKVETTTQSTDSSSVVKQNLITATDSSTEELEVTITEYDTGQPTDSLTKRPPVKKEIKIVRNKGSRKQSEQKQDEHKEAIVQVAEYVHVQDSVKVQTAGIKQETTVPKQIGNVVKWVCALVGLLIAWYIARRFLQR
ncbi:hypothetical protein EVA_18793 [gut metagenome]|uniref:Uncharacterized protein n=1 Tax=gut metagenome TaxID=749906 RepID=J9BZY5_9ZZZZ